MKPMSEDELRRTMVETMKRAGTPPEMVYAFEKTGRLVTAENASQLSEEDLAEWDAAVEEYWAKHPKI